MKITRARAKSVYINRIRMMFFSVLFIFTIIMLSAIISNANSNNKFYTYYRTITIEEGDTLAEYSYIYNADNIVSDRKYVDDVMRINHLCDDKITAGQHLVIPYYSTERK